VIPNEPVSDFHHFDEIDLIAVGSLTRIFPDQQTFAVGEPSAGPMPAR
jgi:hypothetical protein